MNRFNETTNKGCGIVAALLLFGASLAFAHSSPSPTSDYILLAQEEGDYDQAFDAYGQDVDEVIEEDEAIIPVDTLKAEASGKQIKTDIDSLIRGIHWLGHAAFLIEDTVNIYIDPFDLPDGLPAADIVLITHEHSDHFSPEDLAKILKPTSILVSTGEVLKRLPKTVKHSKSTAPGDTISVEGVSIEAVPAYNIGKDYHPKKKGYLGFIITHDGRRIYHAGDTDLIPEMKHINADIAMLPVGGKFTMDAEEAAEAANLIKPKVAIPMHWGTIIGDEKDARAFKAKTKIPVLIMEAESRPAEEGEE